jgi:hypothetical protein
MRFRICAYCTDEDLCTFWCDAAVPLDKWFPTFRPVKQARTARPLKMKALRFFEASDTPPTERRSVVCALLTQL